VAEVRLVFGRQPGPAGRLVDGVAVGAGAGRAVGPVSTVVASRIGAATAAAAATWVGPGAAAAAVAVAVAAAAAVAAGSAVAAGDGGAAGTSVGSSSVDVSSLGPAGRVRRAGARSRETVRRDRVGGWAMA
jgi:hypothetical protein